MAFGTRPESMRSSCDCLVCVKHSTQMFACIAIGRAQIGGLRIMRRIIGLALIVLSLTGCAMDGTIPGDSAWSRDYLKGPDKKHSPG